MARVIDLGRHPPTVVGQADELVPEDAPKTHITPGQLQIGLADPDQSNREENLAGARRRFG